MKNITRPEGSNYGGLHTIYFKQFFLVQNIPDAVESVVSDDITISDASLDWFEIDCIPGTLNFKEDPQGPDQYRQVITGQVRKDIPGVLHTFNEMARHRFILLARDNNKQLRIVGTLDQPATFSFVRDTKNDFTKSNHYQFTFEAVSAEPSYFYTGNYQVVDDETGSELFRDAKFITAFNELADDEYTTIIDAEAGYYTRHELENAADCEYEIDDVATSFPFLLQKGNTIRKRLKDAAGNYAREDITQPAKAILTGRR